jgi:hypothetical protein
VTARPPPEHLKCRRFLTETRDMRPIYHFTHASNVPRILTDRALKSSRRARVRRDIGDVSIKRARRARVVDCGPGGVIADYVPFYFAPRSPMLYRLRAEEKEGRGAGQRPLVYLVSSTERVVSAGRRFVFTDANARATAARFSDDLTKLDEYVDWELMGCEYWNNSADDPSRRSRRQAEFLVHELVPLQCIMKIGVFENVVARVIRRVLEQERLDIDIDVVPEWYFKL